MKLTENLSLAEVTYSATALRKEIVNEPTVTHLINLKAVANNIFQPCRDYFGKPLAVTSGYRSKALNDLIGGAKSSQHCKGEALDLDAQVFGGFTNLELFLYIKDHLSFDQLIGEFPDNMGEYAWVHCSYKEEGNRGEVLVAYNDGGETRYKRL
jgi:zinc D-Ala-D-Ala carboxypeptidase